MKSQLQAMRKRAGYKSAREFAEHIGMSLNTYNNYEQGKSNIPIELAWELADVLHCSLDELAGRTWPPVPSTPELSSAEQSLIESYRATDARGRSTIEQVAQSQAGDMPGVAYQAHKITA